MKNFFKNILYFIFIVLFIDFICFACWVFSNQPVPEGFYFGKLTVEIIKFIIGIWN